MKILVNSYFSSISRFSFDHRRHILLHILGTSFSDLLNSFSFVFCCHKWIYWNPIRLNTRLQNETYRYVYSIYTPLFKLLKNLWYVIMQKLGSQALDS